MVTKAADIAVSALAREARPAAIASWWLPVDAPGFIVAQILGAFATTSLFLWLIPTLPKRAEDVMLPNSDNP